MSVKRFSLLIGIDFYLPNNIQGSSYPALRGCVHDVLRVKEFLKWRGGFDDESIVCLTSQAGANGHPIEAAELRPSYENIIGQLQRLTQFLGKGDVLHVHYSAHGGRVPTSIPKVKGEKALDEALVPFDIGNSAARYVRDHELALLFKRLVDRGIVSTFVMDCCHSGGLTRGGDVGVRGVEFVDRTDRRTDSLVGSVSALEQHWKSLAGVETRGLSTIAHDPGYTLLAACRPSELAKEYAVDGVIRMGALTYWTLDTLAQADGSTSWKVIHDRVCQKVHAQFYDQTPMLLGDPSRVPFADGQVAPVFAVPVVTVSEDVVELGGGQATGLRLESQLAIYPRGTIDFSQVERRVAIVEITDVGAVRSMSKIVTAFPGKKPESGDQAILLTAPIKMIRIVRFAPFDDSQSGADEALFAPVRKALAGNGWVQEAAPGASAQYYVRTDKERKTYFICQADGEVPLLLRPPVAVDGGASIVSQRLQHLARYDAVRAIDNFSSVSPLRGKLVVDMLALPDNFEDGVDDPNVVGKLLSGSPLRLKVGQKACLRLSNRSASVLNLAVLDLQPDWGITQVYPGGDFEPLDPRDPPICLPLVAWLQPGYELGLDTLKIFATLEGTSFRALELPSLDAPTRGVRSMSLSREDPLELLFSEFEQLQPRTRNINISGAPREWTVCTLQVEISRD